VLAFEPEPRIQVAANEVSEGSPFRDAVGALRKWYVAERLEAALGAFYQNARGRVHIVVIPPYPSSLSERPPGVPLFGGHVRAFARLSR
jgi:hypothetical protein